MKIFNEFGIKPTRNHTAAGYDFYVPNIKVSIDESESILEAFSKSYNRSVDELKTIVTDLYYEISSTWGEDKIVGQELNVLLLYLALDSPKFKYNYDDSENIVAFINNYLIFDKDGKPGITAKTGDHIFINSGIHTALNPGEAGVFFNKSGKGLKGWDVRAQVVDEDYTGFVHLSLCYTKPYEGDGTVYVGDKIIQMLVLKVGQSDVEEVDKEMYESLMSNSERGSSGFGSSDEKH